MAPLNLWTIRLFALMSLIFLSVSHPFNAPPDSNLQIIRNQTETSTLSHSLFDIEKRAPPALRPYSKAEQQLNRKIGLKINDYLRDNDCIWFVGNSGTYLGLPFDQKRYNMKSIPISSSKHYGELEQQHSQAGLARYFKMILGPTIIDKTVTRFVLVDHSGSGQSVDGFRKAFLDMVKAYWLEGGATEADAKVAMEYYRDVPMVLINVIDFKRRPGGGNPVTKPTTVHVKAIICEGNKGEVNRLVGDDAAHDRVTANYPANKWETPAKDCWGSETISAADEFENGKAMRDNIIKWNKDNGGLITPKKSNKATFSEKLFYWPGYPVRKKGSSSKGH